MNLSIFSKILLVISLFTLENLFSMNTEEFLAPHPDVRMRNAIIAGDLSRVKDLIELYKSCPEVLIDLEDNETPLHVAIAENKKEIFDYLINETVFGTWDWINSATVYIDYDDNGELEEHENDTPLLTCVKKRTFNEDDFDVVHKLLLHGADINAQDYDNNGTALWSVADLRKFGENIRLARLLTDSGTDLSLLCKHIHDNRGYETPRGCTACERAKESKYVEMAGFLSAREIFNLSLVEHCLNIQMTL